MRGQEERRIANLFDSLHDGLVKTLSRTGVHDFSKVLSSIKENPIMTPEQKERSDFLLTNVAPLRVSDDRASQDVAR